MKLFLSEFVILQTKLSLSAHIGQTIREGKNRKLVTHGQNPLSESEHTQSKKQQKKTSELKLNVKFLIIFHFQSCPGKEIALAVEEIGNANQRSSAPRHKLICLLNKEARVIFKKQRSKSCDQAQTGNVIGDKWLFFF